MAAFTLFSNRNTSNKVRAIKINTGTAAVISIDDPRVDQPSSQNDWYSWDGHKFKANSNQAPANGDYIVAYDDMANYLVDQLDFENNWHASGDTAVSGSMGAVVNDPAATGSGGAGTQE